MLTKRAEAKEKIKKYSHFILYNVGFYKSTIIPLAVFTAFLDRINLVIRTGYEETRWTFPDQKTEKIMERDQDIKEEKKVICHCSCAVSFI